MKAIKTLVAIALSAGGLGTAVTLGAVANKENTNNIQIAEASVTNGKYRINVLTNSANWLKDNVNTLFKPGNSNVCMNRDNDFTQSQTNNKYSTVTIGNTSYNWITYEFSAKTDYTNNSGNNWFGRGTSDNLNGYNWFDSGVNFYNQFRNSDNDNTILISGSFDDGFSAQAYGWYNKYAVHTGVDNNTINYYFAGKDFVPSDPAAVDGYTFVGWYTDSSHSTKWTSGSQTTDTNLYAKYVHKTSGYYLVGNDAFKTEMGTTGAAWDFESGVRMNDVTSGGNKASYTITTSTTITFKARRLDLKTDYYVANTEKSDTATEHGVTFDKDGNYVVPAGTYTLYVFVKNNEDTSSLTYGMPLDSYCTEFLDETGAVCNGSSTNESALATVWATLKADWAKLHVNDQNSLVDADANESGTDVQKVMARYDVIIKNHASFEDFMNRKANSHYTYKANVTTQIPSNNDSSIMIIVVASSITLLATGMFFLLRKKRKEQ